MPVFLIRALNVTSCSSHRTCTPSFLPTETMVGGRRGAEETIHVLSHTESIYIYDMHFTKDQERHPRLSSLDTALESSGWQAWVTAYSCGHRQGPVLHKCSRCFMLHPKSTLPLLPESYHICCEKALGSSFIAIFLNSFSRGSCNQELGDKH